MRLCIAWGMRAMYSHQPVLAQARPRSRMVAARWSCASTSIAVHRFKHDEFNSRSRTQWLAANAASSGARLVLGIETSCDDTGAAVVTSDGRVLGEAIAHQAEIHAAWGGVVPNLAMEAHKEAIDRVVDQALARAGVDVADLDAVAVTMGPGLSLCLKVGVVKARSLARQHSLPLVYVHHMEGHALVARLPPTAATTASALVDCTAPAPSSSTAAQGASDASSSGRGAADVSPSPAAGTQPQAQAQSDAGPSPSEAHSSPSAAAAAAAPTAPMEAVQFPFLCLLVSGGHNLLLLVQGVGQYMQLGSTLDDALGEAYDKIARLLGLELKPNGGAALEALARQGNPQAYKFAVPMRKHASCDFSYAGLKTSVRLAIEQAAKQHSQQLPEADQEVRPASEPGTTLPMQVKADIAASFQYVACQHLTERVKRGVKWAREVVPDLGALVVAGGVASNQYVRGQLTQLAVSEGLALVMPPPRWCTDNGVMIAWAGIERMNLGLEEATELDFATAPTRAVPADVPAPQPSSTDGTDVSTSPEGAEEWVQVRPRWPLTSEQHPRRAPDPWNARKARMHTSLTDLTAAAAAAARAAQEQGSPQEAATLSSV